MSIFKQFLSQDVIITPFQVNKSFLFTGSSALTSSNVGIDRFIGTNITGDFNPNSDLTTGQISTGSYQRCVYNSIKTLYYSNYLSSSYGDEAVETIINNGFIISANNQQPQFENYLQSTLTASRFFPTGSSAQIGVISIPVSLFGEQIRSKTFFMSSTSGSLFDDGEGNLYSTLDRYIDFGYVDLDYYITISGSFAGNIIYPHGLLIITNPDIIPPFVTSDNVTMSFQSTYTIYETQYKCTIRESEFNYSFNTSLLTGSFNDTVKDFVTSSFFTPYITTVGLYNDNQELLAIAKLSQPLPSSQTTDQNIVINIDK